MVPQLELKVTADAYTSSEVEKLGCCGKSWAKAREETRKVGDRLCLKAVCVLFTKSCHEKAQALHVGSKQEMLSRLG